MQVSTCVLDVQAPIRYHGNLGSNMHMWYHPTVCNLRQVYEVGNGDKLCARCANLFGDPSGGEGR